MFSGVLSSKNEDVSQVDNRHESLCSCAHLVDFEGFPFCADSSIVSVPANVEVEPLNCVELLPAPLAAASENVGEKACCAHRVIVSFLVELGVLAVGPLACHRV